LINHSVYSIDRIVLVSEIVHPTYWRADISNFPVCDSTPTVSSHRIRLPAIPGCPKFVGLPRRYKIPSRFLNPSPSPRPKDEGVERIVFHTFFTIFMRATLYTHFKKFKITQLDKWLKINSSTEPKNSKADKANEWSRPNF